MYTKQQLFEQLKAMNAPKDSVVLMHTSLRAVGEFEGRGEGLLDALIEYFTENGGLFCVPTHTWNKLCGGKGELTLDMNCTKTCIGTFPDIAAASTKGVRTSHPTHSMVVFGDDAKVKEFIAGEENIDTSTHPDGCYGKLYKYGGYVLLVGVAHANNTYIHSVEEMLDIPERISEKHVDVTVKLRNGTVVPKKLRHHIGFISKQFPKFEPAFRHHGCIVDGYVGNAVTQLCDARKMKEVVELIWERSGHRDTLIQDEIIDEKYWK